MMGTDIHKAKSILESGGLVAIPTETVYGLAANGLSKDAVLKIFEAKNRPFFDPLILHVPSVEKAEELVSEFPAKARLLAEKFWPGPLTLLLTKKNNVPDIVTSGLPNVAVRVPKHKLTLQLLSSLNFPLAAPSANPFGYVSPTSAAHVEKQLGEKVDYILDGGECEVGLESTIIGFEGQNVFVHRLGGLSIEEIESAIGPVTLSINSSSNPKAPGQLKSHYAPRKPLYIGDIETLMKHHRGKKIAVISFTNEYAGASMRVLSKRGDLHEAAHNLFTALRDLDESDAEIILAETFPDEFLGRAINDRLRRASASESL